MTGRKKELIIRGGHNIDPAMIEEPLYQLEGVQVAAAVGRPDPHAGEVPVAFVQLQEESDLTAEQILEHLQKEVGERAALPKEVTILKEIPLTPVGKIFKPALQPVSDIRLKVTEDKVHGVLAHIRLKPSGGVSSGQLENKVNELLARYTVKYDLEITD